MKTEEEIRKFKKDTLKKIDLLKSGFIDVERMQELKTCQFAITILNWVLEEKD